MNLAFPASITDQYQTTHDHIHTRQISPSLRTPRLNHPNRYQSPTILKPLTSPRRFAKQVKDPNMLGEPASAQALARHDRQLYSAPVARGVVVGAL
jgi:hypothetical protein